MELNDYPDDGSATFRVFHTKYKVLAPRSLTLSEAEIKLYGQRTSGIKQLDKYLANEMISGFANTVQIAQIVEDGGFVTFCDPKEVIRCYTDLHQHLVNWEFILSEQYNVTPPPIDELQILKDFMASLERYKQYFDEEDMSKNPLGHFSVLDGKSFRRKKAPIRHYIGATTLAPRRNDDDMVIIKSWEDIPTTSGGRGR